MSPSSTSKNVRRSKQSSTAAKVLYRPFGLASGIIGGLVAGVVYKQVWKRVSSTGASEAPKALSTEYRFREILIATVVQGAVFALVKTLIDRGGARMFEGLTGKWPND